MIHLQRAFLLARKFPLVKKVLSLFYTLGEKAFVLHIWLLNLSLGRPVQAVYLRRGGGRGELLPGASDLDFFLVLRSMGGEEEMRFLKEFWKGFGRWKFFFPFWGETLMGDSNEVDNWLSLSTVRGFETQFSWKLLSGKNLLSRSPPFPDSQDIFSEALKNYWDILQPIVKLRPEDFHCKIRSYEKGAIYLRHSAKAALDLFRLHRSFSEPQIWQASREALITLLPEKTYGKEIKALRPFLFLEDPLFSDSLDPMELFAGLAQRALECLEEISMRIDCKGQGGLEIKNLPEALIADSHSYSVRELFAERILLRHRNITTRSLLSRNNSQMFFILHKKPTREEFKNLLADLRDVNFSFDRFSLALPLGEKSLLQMETSSFLDSPFHSFQGQTDLRLTGEDFESRTYHPQQSLLPTFILEKTLVELCFSLRLRPTEINYFLENRLNLVLGLRLVGQFGEIPSDLFSTINRYEKFFPSRIGVLKNGLAPFFSGSLEEETAWERLFASLEEPDILGNSTEKNSFLIIQLRQLREKNRQKRLSKSLASDAWIDLTPFLRTEINRLKENFFKTRPSLKI